MVTVTAHTAGSQIVSAAIVGNDLVLTRFDGTTVNAGNVRGPEGPTSAAEHAALVAQVTALTPTAWTNFSFVAPWANHGGGFNTGQYRKVGDRVELRGLVRITTGTVAAGIQSGMHVLPVGFRPVAAEIMATVSYSGTNNQAVQIRITTGGSIVYYTDIGNTLTTSGWVTLTGLSFSTI